VEPAVEPVHLALAEGDALTRIGQLLGLPGFAPGWAWDPRAVARFIGEVVPAFAGVDLDSVGLAGMPLRGGASA
jgi:hypothetical protein